MLDETPKRLDLDSQEAHDLVKLEVAKELKFLSDAGRDFLIGTTKDVGPMILAGIQTPKKELTGDSLSDWDGLAFAVPSTTGTNLILPFNFEDPADLTEVMARAGGYIYRKCMELDTGLIYMTTQMASFSTTLGEDGEKIEGTKQEIISYFTSFYWSDTLAHHAEVKRIGTEDPEEQGPVESVGPLVEVGVGTRSKMHSALIGGFVAAMGDNEDG